MLVSIRNIENVFSLADRVLSFALGRRIQVRHSIIRLLNSNLPLTSLQASGGLKTVTKAHNWVWVIKIATTNLLDATLHYSALVFGYYECGIFSASHSDAMLVFSVWTCQESPSMSWLK